MFQPPAYLSAGESGFKGVVLDAYLQQELLEEYFLELISKVRNWEIMGISDRFDKKRLKWRSQMNNGAYSFRS